ncbi:alpha/beta hydrolase [Rhodobacteraceae bacterium NNCM2]|nr:alpha/beta hydrolase [Coraliihabitans acroporae]
MLTPPFINMRTRPAGGNVREVPHAVLSSLGRRRQIILMVHGFNTTRDEAQEGYEAFRLLVSRSAPRLAERLCPVYWPGDSSLRGSAYPWLVERSAECGARLADWLAGQEGEVTIIAHSLGCRMSLEALARLAGQPGGPSIRLFLMAAAVPVGLVQNDARLERALSRAASVDVLHSSTDGVLAFWFRIGQSVTPGESEVFPEAVGLRGAPGEATWHRSSEMPGYEHATYWYGNRVANHLAYRLGASVAKPRPARVASHARVPPTRPDAAHRPDPAHRRMEHRR